MDEGTQELDGREVEHQLAEFVAHVVSEQLPVVLLTSGGTTAPLEHNTVRFLDNFSTGRRGAACTEHLLSREYAICLLRRRGSLAPFARHVLPDQLLADLAESAESEPARLTVTGESARRLLAPARQLRRARAAGRLLTLPFTSVDEYLALLAAAARAVAPLGRRALVLLAAAVSDFHLPADERAEHKMASADALTLRLRAVPKMVGELCAAWCPAAFVVTFKLETDASVLVERARAALARYGHALVVANLLQTRRDAVTMVTRHGTLLVQSAAGGELEEAIVEDLTRRHRLFMEGDGSEGDA